MFYGSSHPKTIRAFEMNWCQYLDHPHQTISYFLSHFEMKKNIDCSIESIFVFNECISMN